MADDLGYEVNFVIQRLNIDEARKRSVARQRWISGLRENESVQPPIRGHLVLIHLLEGVR